MKQKSSSKLFWLALSCLFLGFSSLQAEKTFVINQNTGTKYRDLQQAIDAASSGDSLSLQGTFKGSFRVKDKSLNLYGSNQNNGFAVLDGNKSGRVLEIAGTNAANPNQITLNLTNLIIQNGSADHGGGISSTNAQLNLSYVFVAYNQATNHGGGIANFNGQLQIVNSMIAYNKAASGGGIDSTNGTLSIYASDIASNIATQFGGGGVLLTSTNATIQNSTLFGNSAGFGGALDNETNSVLNVYQSTFCSNSADAGGALFNNATLYVNQSTLTQNSAKKQGGALYNDSDAFLSALSSSTIAFNQADLKNSESGGGIFNAGQASTLQLQGCNLLLNQPGDLFPNDE